MNLLTKEQSEKMLGLDLDVSLHDVNSDDTIIEEDSLSDEVLDEAEVDSQIREDIKNDTKQMLSIINKVDYLCVVDSFKDDCQAIMRTAETKSLIDLFSLNQYIIPCLQRVYEWQPTKQVKTMLDDIRQAFRNNIVGYSLTDVLVYKPSPMNQTKTGNDNIIYVYDGQQRITTLILILIFLRDVFCNFKALLEKDAQLTEDKRVELMAKCDDCIDTISSLLIHKHVTKKNEVVSGTLFKNIVYSDFSQLMDYLINSEGIVFSKSFKDIKSNKRIKDGDIDIALSSDNCKKALDILVYLKDTYPEFKLVLKDKSGYFSLEDKVSYFAYFTKILLETVMVTVLTAKSEAEATSFYVCKNSRGKAMEPYEAMHCEAQVLNTPDDDRVTFSATLRQFDANFKDEYSWDVTSHLERAFLKGLFTNLLGGHGTNENTLVNEITSTLRIGNSKLKIMPIQLKLDSNNKNVYSDDFVEAALENSFNGMFIRDGYNYISWHKTRLFYRDCLNYVLDSNSKDEIYKYNLSYMLSDCPNGKWVSVLTSVCWCWGIDKASFKLSEIISILTRMLLFFIFAKDSLNQTIIDDMFDTLACNVVRKFITGEHTSIEDTVHYIKVYESRHRCLKNGNPVTAENYHIGFNIPYSNTKLRGAVLRGYEFITNPSAYSIAYSEGSLEKLGDSSIIPLSDYLPEDMAFSYNFKWLAIPVSGKSNKVTYASPKDMSDKITQDVASEFKGVANLYSRHLGESFTAENINAFGESVASAFKEYLNIK